MQVYAPPPTSSLRPNVVAECAAVRAAFVANVRGAARSRMGRLQVAQLAALARCSTSHLYALLSKRSCPCLDTLERLALALDCSASGLLAPAATRSRVRSEPPS